ncbi:hypothetical protein HK098_007905 [Nowakowskiella sp. JEL0407]|nr:hypothetical protein HK098_007905 [Nowakowskiella sp. JEL0407]
MTRNLMIPGTITEFYGRSGSGKTQIGIDLVVSLLLHDLQNVNGDTGLRESYSAIVISTDKLFPINRLYKILLQNLPGFDGARIHEVMKNVLLFHIRDYETQVHVLRYHLKPLIHRYNVKLVVVDSITCNLRNLDEDEESLFQGTNKKIHMEKDGRMGFGGSQVINETGYLLRMLAVEYNLVVVCLNQVVANMRKTFGYTEYNEDVDAALGLVWSNLITTRVKVERVDQGMVMDGESISDGRRYMKVIFSPCVGMDSVGFDVTDAGVFGYGE